MKRIFIYALLICCAAIVSCSTGDDTAPVLPIDPGPGGNPTGTTDRPGDNFNLSTLQIETSWNTADRTTVSRDATTFQPTDYFYMNGNKMVLISKEEDGKRTELKETPGQERALTVTKKLSYTAQAYKIPENGVTIAQVHNRASGVLRPLVRVYIDADLRIKFKLTDDPDSASQYTTVNGPLYAEGQVFTVTMTIANGTASFTATTPNGTKSETFTPSSNWAPYASGYYFKAGVYTEGNNTRPEIHFSEFELEK